MPSPIINGSLSPFLQNSGNDFDPSNGYLLTEDYRGFSQSQMSALQFDYVRAGIACRLKFHQGGASTLDVRDSSLQYTIDTWEIVGNNESASGFRHPTAVSIINSTGNPTGVLAGIRQALLQAADWDTFVNTALAALAPGDDDTLGRFYALNLIGQGEYYRGQYVLRHTTNVSNQWAQNIADFGIEQIYSPAQLLTEVQNSALWMLPLPGRLVYKIGAIPAPVPQPNFTFGWLKKASTENTAANNRVNIASEYNLDQWSDDYYALFNP
jgi:hypothetical protein